MEAIYENPNFLSVCEFLPNHLYFVTVQNINNGGSCDAVIPHTEDLHFFNTDNELIYHNFYGDFGPLNITCLYKFCKKLTNKLAAYAGDAFYEKFVNSRFGSKEIVDKLQEKFVKKKVIVYYTSTNNEKRANAAFLISSFALLYLGFSPRTAYKALQPNKMRYRPFQDASVGLSPYKINMKDCLDALHKASAFGFFNFHDFNVSECSYYENIEHGDLNWIIPQKFLAFPGPVEEKNDYHHHPNFYIEYFLCNNVTDVIRLNQRTYDAKCFTLFNIKHHDLYMQDGADPPDSILTSFMNIAESATGAIAVHCQAGLGRTGSLIGAYLLKHYRMTPKEAIAWIRICRPGSVIGHQQTWLETHREILWYQGNEWRYKMYGKTEIVPFLPYGIYSFAAPKKEFSGLREILIELTKRSRYRFMAKNRTKSSKTKLQQRIRAILSSGKTTREKAGGKEEKRVMTATTVRSQPEEEAAPKMASQRSSIHATMMPMQREVESSKNLHYLKPPPPPHHPQHELTCSEYNAEQHERARNHREGMYRYEHQPQPQRTVEYYNPNAYSYPIMSHEVKQPAMYSNPNFFYNSAPPQENEYSQNIYPEEKYNRQGTQESSAIPAIPKSRSARIRPQWERSRPNLASKSIDKNWKQNNANAGAKYYKTYSEGIGKAVDTAKAKDDNICAFDTRAETLTRYSHFHRPYMSHSYLEGPPTDVGDYDQNKNAKYGYKKSGRTSHGFLLSPEDLQSWMETFDEKNSGEQTHGDKFVEKK